MQASLDLIDPPPPYEAYAESPFCASDTNFSAWPSDYYRKTRRIDLEQFYHDVLQASIQQTSDSIEDISYPKPRNSSDSYSSATTDESISYSKPKQVTFCPNPPVVYEYEPEYDITDNIDSDIIQKPTGFKFDEGWPGRAKRASTSSGFLDFKSKIEAQLRAVNDASVMSQINANTADLNHSPPLTTLPNYHPKGFLNFRPVLNPTTCQQDSPRPEPNQDHRFSFSINTTSNKWLDTFSKLKKSNSLLLPKSR